MHYILDQQFTQIITDGLTQDHCLHLTAADSLSKKHERDTDTILIWQDSTIFLLLLLFCI